MIQVTVEEARQRLPDLLGAVEAGEDVEIRGGWAELSSSLPRRPRPLATGVPKAGSCKGLFVVPAISRSRWKSCASTWNEPVARYLRLAVVSFG